MAHREAVRGVQTIIYGYYPVMERLGEALEQLEDEVVALFEHNYVRQLHDAKGELLQLRRVIWPCREIINTIIRNENVLFSPQTMPYLRDCYDHINPTDGHPGNLP